MTDLHDHRPLSRVELMVLARLTLSKALPQAEIETSLKECGLPLSGSALNDCVTATLAALEARALAASVGGPKGTRTSTTSSSKSKQGRAGTDDRPRFKATERGKRALRDAFGLQKTPSWRETRETIVPAHALGAVAGTHPAATKLGDFETMMATLLRRDPLLGEPRTVEQLCDQVIARALGMPPGPVTPAAIRAYALAVHCGVEKKSEFVDIAAKFAPAKGAKTATFNNELNALANRFAQQQLQADFKTKAALVQVLRGHWLSQQDEADHAARPAPLWTAPVRPAQLTASIDPAPAPTSPQPLGVPRDEAGETLLTAVRNAIPMIGSDGRFGRENVFVSALWRQLARDHRLPELSLDGFKRWLVTANRDQLIDLARADLVDAMDAKLVEESEIEDLGSTFHFVIDRQELSFASRQVSHAR